MAEKEKKGFFSKLAEGLKKTRDSLSDKVGAVFTQRSTVDDDFYDELEEALIMADLGVPTVEAVLDELRRRTKEEKISDPQEARQLLREIIADMMRPDTPFAPDSAETSILLVVGGKRRGQNHDHWQAGRGTMQKRGRRCCFRRRIPSARPRPSS